MYLGSSLRRNLSSKGFLSALHISAKGLLLKSLTDGPILRAPQRCLSLTLFLPNVVLNLIASDYCRILMPKQSSQSAGESFIA